MIPEMKRSLDVHNNRRKDRQPWTQMNRNAQTENQKRHWGVAEEQSLSDLWGIMKSSKILVIRVPGRKGRKKQRNIEELMIKISSISWKTSVYRSKKLHKPQEEQIQRKTTLEHHSQTPENAREKPKKQLGAGGRSWWEKNTCYIQRNNNRKYGWFLWEIMEAIAHHMASLKW